MLYPLIKFKKNVIKFGPPLTKLSGSAHVPGLIAQSVAIPTADDEIQGLAGPIHCTFMELDHEIISKVFLLLSLIQEG